MTVCKDKLWRNLVSDVTKPDLVSQDINSTLHVTGAFSVYAITSPILYVYFLKSE